MKRKCQSPLLPHSPPMPTQDGTNIPKKHSPMKPTLCAKQASVENAPRKVPSVSPTGLEPVMKTQGHRGGGTPFLSAEHLHSVPWAFQRVNEAAAAARPSESGWWDLELDSGEGWEETALSKQQEEPQSGHLQGRVSRPQGAVAVALEQSWTLQWLGCREEGGALGPARNSYEWGL